MSIEPDEVLSPAGVIRREEIGRLAGRAAGRRRWRRRTGRAAVLAALIVAAVPLLGRHQHRSSSPAVIAARPASPPPPTVTAVVTLVGTDPTITDRLSVRAGPPRWVVIDDRQLLDALAAAGRPAGLMTMGGRQRLLFRD